MAGTLWLGSDVRCVDASVSWGLSAVCKRSTVVRTNTTWCASEYGVLIECQPPESIPLVDHASIMGPSSSSLPRCMYQWMSKVRGRVQNDTSCVSSDDGTRLSMSPLFRLSVSKTELSRKSQLCLFLLRSRLLIRLTVCLKRTSELSRAIRSPDFRFNPALSH